MSRFLDEARINRFIVRLFIVFAWKLVLIGQVHTTIVVKGSPTNYRTNGFDISWVDNSTQKYYLADRTNNAIDVVDASTDTFLGFIGQGQYTGSRPCQKHPQDLRHCSGPNGVTTDDVGHVWAGDGNGNVIEADATKPGTAILRKIATGGKFRVDEVAYDPADRILMASSDGDLPPFLTFISTTDGSILGRYVYPAGQDGLEQPTWVLQTGWFYQNVPGTKNRIDVFDPHRLPNPLKSFVVECSGGLLGLTLSGLVAGPNGRLMTVCGTVGGKSLDPRTGRVYKTIPQVGDADQVWYDAGSNRYYFAHSTAGATEAATAGVGAIGIVDGATEAFIGDISIHGSGVHSVAVNAHNHHVFVPVNGKGILVFLLNATP
ncbi:MAG: hypothetical protein JOZ32_02580 [Bryobacterales bacterium]|nr:hypothetical protein [Bryobacterales bacterium]